MTNSKQTWETQEVIRHLINDEGCYNILQGESAEEIRQFIEENRSSVPGLYKSFARFNGEWHKVNWNDVARSLKD